MPASTTPGQRFTQLIQQLGLTKNAFAQSLGKTATVIQHIVDERNKPGYDLMNKIREVYPNVSSDWLLSGEGPMLRDGLQPPPVAAPTEPVPASSGIDPADIPDAGPRRRTSNLLQPADIAATLALAAPGHPGHSQHHNGATAKPATPPPAAASSELPLAAAATLGQLPLHPNQPAAPSQEALGPPATAAAPAPDPAYLAAALHTLQLQHQLALAEQRNQHLLEQQALLKQMVELLQRAV